MVGWILQHLWGHEGKISKRSHKFFESGSLFVQERGQFEVAEFQQALLQGPLLIETKVCQVQIAMNYKAAVHMTDGTEHLLHQMGN